MSELSPAAQEVLDAVHEIMADTCIAEVLAIAAALRVAADIVAPLSYEDVWIDGRILQYEKDDPVRNKLLAIADELEAQ
jgi:hypothetical protein